MADIADEAMSVLLCLHHTDNIRLWAGRTGTDTNTLLTTFWHISSQLVFTVCQKLLHHQLCNYPQVLRWMHVLLTSRNAFLIDHRDSANIGTHQPIVKQAQLKLEVGDFGKYFS
jgi:neurofibromin 1